MDKKQKTYDVAAYVWPAYTGNEPRTRIFWPEGYGEWQTVKNAHKNSTEKPAGYIWDRKPLWGYVNEADPKVMEMQIDCAYEHGVNVFIYDWYWYDGRPFLENCLNDGYLKANNNDLVKFYIMWANHDADHMWSIETSDSVKEVIWRGDVSFETFKTITRRWIEKYFSHPSYYKIDGKPVVSIYSITNFLKSFGGIEGAQTAIDYLRKEVRAAGFTDVHIQLVYNAFEGFDYDGRFGGSAGNAGKLLKIDSVTHYNMGTRQDRSKDYTEFTKDHQKGYDMMDAAGWLYFPQVSLGWDNNPRYRRFQPYIAKNNTPENIKAALEQAKAYIDSHDLPVPLVTINSWNEWTETSYLEPDNVYGYGYLEAVKEVFKEE